MLIDTNLVYEWQRAYLQSAVQDNYLEHHVTDKNMVSHSSSLFDITLVLTVGFSLFELAVELLRIETLGRSSCFRCCVRDLDRPRLLCGSSYPQLPSSILHSLRSRIRCKRPHAGVAHHAYAVGDVSLYARLSGQMRRFHDGASDSVLVRAVVRAAFWAGLRC